MRADETEVELRERARMLVRSQLLDADAQLVSLEAAVRAALPDTDAGILARAWLAAERKQHVVDAQSWQRPTDHDRLVAALQECREHDVVVELGVVDPDDLRGRVTSQLARRGPDKPIRGVVWASEPDVFHAVDQHVLDLRPLRADATAAPHDDPLVSAVTGCLERHGLRVRFQVDRIQVAVRWQVSPRV